VVCVFFLFICNKIFLLVCCNATESFEKANKKANKAQDTSDLATEASDVDANGKRKRFVSTAVYFQSVSVRFSEVVRHGGMHGEHADLWWSKVKVTRDNNYA